MTDNSVVYDDNIMITMRGVSDSVGLPYTVNPLELVDREALVELREGPAGSAGPDGDPAWPWQWRGDVADFSALRALNLTTADARAAWRVATENKIYYWTGLEFIAFDQAFGRTGKPGPANVLSGTAVTGVSGSAASARITGTSPGQNLELTLPRGVSGDVGDPGGPGRIQDAADVLIDDDHSLAQDYILAWDATRGKFVPAPSPRRGGPWAIAKNQFSGGTNLNEPKVLAAITIPGQPTRWRPQVTGQVRVNAANGNGYGTRCDVEVRIGGPTGELVGYGFGYDIQNWDWVLIGPRFDFPPTPTTDFGVVQPNQTITLYVIAKRVKGSASFTVDTTGAQLIVYAEPIR
ncbi:hypothetical protein ACWCW7_24525 [Nocardia tengchongensis]